MYPTDWGCSRRLPLDFRDIEESVDELDGLNVVDDEDAEPLDFSDEPDPEIAEDVAEDDDDSDEDDE